jgi:hypothetical protein
MPNRNVHVRVGVLSGTVAAAWCAHHAAVSNIAVEVVAGAVGGAIGGLLPDIIEPATSPAHRNLAHSAAALAAISLIRTAELQAHCREQAALFDRLTIGLGSSSPQRQAAEWNALFWRFLAGLLIGSVVGYASHILLDGQTPAGIPIVGR